MRFGPVKFPFTRAADPNRVLDEVAEEEDRRERLGSPRNAEPLHLPYWAELWDSGGGIAQHLVQRYYSQGQSDSEVSSACGFANQGDPIREAANGSAQERTDLAGRSVLDLGCGQGLTGCVAAALGAKVLFADLESPALLFAQLNAFPWIDRIRSRRTDWQTDDLGETFDLIIGADILYERSQWDFLEPFWRKHLSSDGKIILGEPGRPTGDVFGDWIKPRGWKVELFEQRVPSRDRPIRIFELMM